MIGDDPRPLHVFLEEAEEFLPQRVDAKSARMVGAYSKISKQGRTLGLGVTLITQRSASLNKDALSQTDTLILFRTVSPHDRKAVVAWAEYHDEAKEVAQTLVELEPGESWILSPGFLRSMQRIRWRRRRTFDSGATPKTGSKPRVPVSLADIDLGEIKERMADTLERAKADDPKELRNRIGQLEKQIATHKCPESTAERVEVPVISNDDRQLLQASIEQIHTAGVDLGQVAHNMLNVVNEGRTVGVGWDKPQPAEEKRSPRPTRLVTGGIVKKPPVVSEANPESSDPEVTIGKGEQKVLAVLAQWPQGRTYNELAFLAGWRSGAGRGWMWRLIRYYVAGYGWATVVVGSHLGSQLGIHRSVAPKDDGPISRPGYPSPVSVLKSPSDTDSGAIFPNPRTARTRTPGGRFLTAAPPPPGRAAAS